MTRRSITKAMRVRIFLAANGACHICGLKIDAPKQRWDVEHVKALSMGGADDETNMRPAHVECHAVKSAEETTLRAKSDRARARHLGVRKPPTLKSAGFEPRPPQRRATSPLSKQPVPRRNSDGI